MSQWKRSFNATERCDIIKKNSNKKKIYIYQKSVGQPPPLTLGQPPRQIHRQNPRPSLTLNLFAV